MLAGGGGKLFGGGAGDGFGEIEERVVFALAEILRVEKFGKADDLSAASGGVGDAFESFG